MDRAKGRGTGSVEGATPPRGRVAVRRELVERPERVARAAHGGVRVQHRVVDVRVGPGRRAARRALLRALEDLVGAVGPQRARAGGGGRRVEAIEEF